MLRAHIHTRQKAVTLLFLLLLAWPLQQLWGLVLQGIEASVQQPFRGLPSTMTMFQGVDQQVTEIETELEIG
jgi:hypothetical protein